MKALFTFIIIVCVSAGEIFTTQAQPGSLDFTFDPGTGPSDFIKTSAIQTDGKIIIGGQFLIYNGTPANFVTRVKDDGTLDTSFHSGSGADYLVLTSALQNNGQIIIGGAFGHYDGVAKPSIARLNDNGTLDNNFDPGTGADGYLYASAVQSNGKILIGGGFFLYNGVPRNGIARLNTDGSLDPTFTPGMGTTTSGLNYPVYTIAIQTDGKIIIGGTFTTYNDTAENYITRLNTDGSIDTSFHIGTGPTSAIRTMCLQPDGKIIIAGDFDSCDGTARNYIARLNADGTVDTDFDPGTGTDGIVYTTALQTDGKIIIGGSFNTFNDSARKCIARVNTDGSLDQSFYPGAGANSHVYTSALQNDGKIIIGGVFNSYDNTGRNHIARVIGGGTAGIENVVEENNSIRIFPNPFASSAILQMDAQLKDADVIISNMLGKEMRRNKLTGNGILLIEKGNLESGIYFVNVTANGKQYVRKVIIE